jgi:hypothetical protein
MAPVFFFFVPLLKWRFGLGLQVHSKPWTGIASIDSSYKMLSSSFHEEWTGPSFAQSYWSPSHALIHLWCEFISLTYPDWFLEFSAGVSPTKYLVSTQAIFNSITKLDSMSNYDYGRRFNLSTLLNLKAYGSVSNTSKPKHTIADKGSCWYLLTWHLFW